MVYVLIDILNIQLLKENSFVAACVIVWGGAYIMNKVFATNVQNQHIREIAKFYEKIYTDDVSGLRKEVFKDLILEISATVYLLLAIIGFATLNAGEFVVYVVFGFFFLLSCKNTYKLLVKYYSIKNVSSLSEFTIVFKRFNLGTYLGLYVFSFINFKKSSVTCIYLSPKTTPSSNLKSKSINFS